MAPARDLYEILGIERGASDEDIRKAYRRLAREVLTSFLADSGARALGCPVILAVQGNTEQQLDFIEAFRSVRYVSVPAFLHIILYPSSARVRDFSCIR